VHTTTKLQTANLAVDTTATYIWYWLLSIWVTGKVKRESLPWAVSWHDWSFLCIFLSLKSLWGLGSMLAWFLRCRKGMTVFFKALPFVRSRGLDVFWSMHLVYQTTHARLNFTFREQVPASCPYFESWIVCFAGRNLCVWQVFLRSNLRYSVCIVLVNNVHWEYHVLFKTSFQDILWDVSFCAALVNYQVVYHFLPHTKYLSLPGRDQPQANQPKDQAGGRPPL